MDYIAKLLAKVFGASWRTTILGYAGLVSSVGVFLTSIGNFVKFYLDGDPATVPVWGDVALSFTAVSVAWGLVFARDNKVSSQDVGIR